MEINRHNYETWFLDFAEGILSADEREMVLNFVNQHPDLKEEFEQFDLSLTMMTEEYAFEEKEELKKHLSADYSDDELIIGYLAGDLKENQRSKVASRLELDSGFRQLYNQYKNLVLIPDDIVFDSNQLMVRGPVLEQLDNYLIGFLEDDLSLVEQVLLKYHMEKHPESKVELEAFQRIKLIPDENLVFENKGSLKKSTPIFIQMYRWTAVVAAAAILLFFLLPFLQKEQSIEPEQIVMESPAGQAIQEKIIDDPADELVDNELLDEDGPEELDHMEERINNHDPQELIAKSEKTEENWLLNKNVDLHQISEPEVVSIPDGTIDEVPIESHENSHAPTIEEGIAMNNDPIEEDERITDKIQSENDAPMKNASNQPGSTNNNFHILDAVEVAGEKTGLYTFSSNVKQNSDYNEFSFGIGKFKISRKAKKKSRS